MLDWTLNLAESTKRYKYPNVSHKQPVNTGISDTECIFCHFLSISVSWQEHFLIQGTCHTLKNIYLIGFFPNVDYRKIVINFVAHSRKTFYFVCINRNINRCLAIDLPARVAQSVRVNVCQGHSLDPLQQPPRPFCWQK